MRVLFSNAPWNQLDESGRGWRGIKAGSRWPHTMPCYGNDMVGGYMPFPFFLATAGALAKKNGFEAVVRDSIAMGESYEDFYRFIDDFRPDVVILETSTPSLSNDLAIATRLKQMQEGLVTVFTGIHFELEEEWFLAIHPEVDYIIYGEYEKPVNDLLGVLRAGEGLLHSVPGLLYRKNGTVVKTDSEPLVDFASLPWPERDDLPYANYYDGVCGLERPQLQMLSTRGCPFKCIFCVWPQIMYRSNKYRMRTPEDVVNEIARNFEKHPYKSFYIDDDTFNVNKKHVLAVAKGIKERGLHTIPWGIMARADLMNEEMLLALREAGLYSLKYGVESASQEVLDEIGKKLDLNQVRRIIAFTKDIGIKVHLTFTFGLPSDTVESIEDTIDFACSLLSDSVQFSIATPFPGTKMYEIYTEKGWITTKDWDRYNGAASAVSRTDRFTGEQLEEYVRQAYKRWNDTALPRMLQSGDFTGRFKEKMASAVKVGGKVLVLQCATYMLTRELVRQLEALQYETHLLLHERFVDKFSGLLPQGRMHIFTRCGDFTYDQLKDYAAQLAAQHGFDGAVVPYSNPSGCGYEEVERIALLAGGKIAACVASDGTIVK